MGAQALLNVTSYVDGHDFTGDSNQGALAFDAAVLDASTFRSGGWSEIAHGLRSVQFNLSGFWQSALSDAVDPELWAAVGQVDRVHTVAPDEIAAGPAYLFRAGENTYQLLDGGLELAKFTMNAQNTGVGGAARGGLAKIKGAASATGQTGVGVNLGAVAANQYLYASLHVFTAGTTITIQVQSDDNSGFTTPTTVGTIGPLTVRGGAWMARVAGPLTDTWYRFNVSAVTGAFVIAGAIGIG